MIHFDRVAADEADLTAAPADDDVTTIGLHNKTGVTLATVLTVPDGKVVYILDGTTLETDSGSKDLTVEGIVYVEADAVLDTSAGKVAVKETGRVHVLKAGTLTVATALSVNDGATPSAATVLGTGKVAIGGALAYTGTRCGCYRSGACLCGERRHTRSNDEARA
ncbi:MAG: hypothetical protein LBG27_08840 [Spirochaetaceae bacterium]|nr:hypothetical protein [Spirochaetaceae bacterium]